MLFKRLEIKNFLSIESIEFSFPVGVHLIQGRNFDMSVDGVESNGAGKSSILEASEWALWGGLNRSTSIKADDVVNKEVGKDCLVRIVFESGGKNWEIVRTRKHSLYGNSIRWWVDGHEKTLQGTNPTNNGLEEALPISRKVFRHAIQIGQGAADRFLSLSETGKQELLCDILSLNLYDDALLVAKNSCIQVGTELSAVEEQIRDMEDKIEKWEVEYVWANEELKNLLQNLEKDDLLEKRRIGLISGFAEIKDEVDKLRLEYMEKTKEYQKELMEVSQKREETYSGVRKAEAERDQQRGLWDDRIEEVQGKFRKWEVALGKIETQVETARCSLHETEFMGDKCPQCGQSVTGVEEYQSNIARMKGSLQGKEETKESMERDRETVLRALKDLQDGKKDALQKWDSYLLSQRQKAEAEVSSATSSLSQMDEDCNRLGDVFGKKSALLEETEKRLKEVESALSIQAESIRQLEIKRARVEEKVKILGGYIAENRSSLEKRSEDRLILKKRFDHWEYWKMSIPNLRAAAMDEVLGYLNEKIAEYLYLFSSGVMGMSMNQQKRGKGSRIKVDLRTPGGSYEMSSGGERRRVDLSIYLALSDLVHAASGVSCNVLVADEIMDGLSPEGVRKFASVLRKKADEGMCVLVVSHNPAVRQMVEFDSVLTVERRDGKAILV